MQQINCIQSLCKIFDWTIITNGHIESLNCIYSILLVWNQTYSKKIAIKLGPVNKIEVYVKKYINESNNGISLTNGSIINEQTTLNGSTSQLHELNSTLTGNNNNNISMNSNSANNSINMPPASAINDDNVESNNFINLDWLTTIQKTYNYINIDDNNVYPGRTLINKFELFLADMAFN